MPPSAASGDAWPIERPEVPPEKRPSVSRAQALPMPLDFEIARGIEHFLHAGAAARAFIAGDEHVALLDLIGQDHLDGVVLALENAG